MALPDILRAVYGKVLAKLALAGLLAAFFAYFALMLRKTAAVVSAYAPVPGGAVAALFAAVACLAALYPFRGLARVASFCFFPAFAAVTLIMALSIGQYDFKLLAPALGYGLKPIVEQGFSLFAAAVPFLAAMLFAGSFDGAAGYSLAARQRHDKQCRRERRIKAEPTHPRKPPERIQRGKAGHRRE
jgi:hypothetical protein